MKNIFLLLIFTFALSQAYPSAGDSVYFFHDEKNNSHLFVMSNEKITQSVTIVNGILCADTLATKEQWSSAYGHRSLVLAGDAGYKLEIVWNRWFDRPPGTNNNADNLFFLSNEDFIFTKYELRTNSTDVKILSLYFVNEYTGLELVVNYCLENEKFYSKRSIEVTDHSEYGHFLEKITTLESRIDFFTTGMTDNVPVKISYEGGTYAEETGNLSQTVKQKSVVVKKGEFGQPAAISNNEGGAFFGIEYPAATNELYLLPDGTLSISCYETIGSKIGKTPVESNWTVIALTPEPFIEKWFYTYLDDVRVAPALPYTIYNSWYDLRSPEYPNVPADAVMNEANVERIWYKLRDNMINKYDIQLDAFVLDDGWDVYESDWQLRKKQFPKGLKPLAEEMQQSGTELGIWIGPTGGYSFAMKRTAWMKANGYEITGNPAVYGSAMLCVAGKNYSALLKKRTSDFVKKDKVAYFKWDGIQFSCSEVSHGHLAGIHSRKAVLDSVIMLSKNARLLNPKIYLNITSGTWLSPWWVKYANQIWMDAADYAFADIPAFSRRDNADTYRDFALYDDFFIRDSWFPISNLMTHGIIKGRLESISQNEPFDKFTNSVVLYFARGVSMWELYISPDELTDREWASLSASISWAKSNFYVLSSTFMIGGNPAHGSTYGYVHFKENKGIVAVRNPKIENDRISIPLSAEYGLNDQAASLVVEQVYPKRYIFPQLYSAGGKINIDMQGFETAIFSIYPLETATFPLLADAFFSLNSNGDSLRYEVYSAGNKVRFLNSEKIEKMSIEGTEASFRDINPDYKPDVIDPGIQVKQNVSAVRAEFVIDPSKSLYQQLIMISVLLTDDGKNDTLPKVILRQGNTAISPTSEIVDGKWVWYSASLDPAVQEKINIEIVSNGWKGKVDIYGETLVIRNSYAIQIQNTSETVSTEKLPLPYPENEFRAYRKFAFTNF